MDDLKTNLKTVWYGTQKVTEELKLIFLKQTSRYLNLWVAVGKVQSLKNYL